ncbi:hypothetical protein K469DRAFT_609814 [Zopfia rhizophila CBS 207.26]|uniref:DUF1772-domain-containing protein n=1 Tax=Zopfia rhizophila CBS 207.26 TaxID=1314779 RepID=A0A6A6DCI7_9PEZI|nr:hypothetical protein K469DRAFT_609814 [Zopfia rhizophila CBS 207.26]
MATTLPLLSIAALSGYGAYLSYNNITRLQRYEEQTKKAAQHSNTAAERLQKTRTTQGSAAITIALSLITAISLVLLQHTEHHSITQAISLVNATTLLVARVHVANFWNDKAKVPFVEGYNEAIKGSGSLENVLALLGCGWGIMGFASWAVGG